MPNLKGRSFINTLDSSPPSWILLDRAKVLKKARGKKGKRPLDGKSVALVFFKPVPPHPRLVRGRHRRARRPGGHHVRRQRVLEPRA